MAERQNTYDVVVIGAGGAGITAAISASRKKARVLLCEKMPKIAKKVRISGNGRCNLTNDKLDHTCFNKDAKAIVESVFAQFGRLDILKFFKELGLRLYSDKEGRVFPITNQSASVIDVLELELSRLGVEIRTGCEVKSIRKASQGFEIEFKGDGFAPVTAKKVILAAGGKSYPIYGTDGTAYELAIQFGHTLTEPVPSTVPLLCEDPWCKQLTGQKIVATVRWEIDGKMGPPLEHDLLFTDYGLSGLAIFDSSDELAIAIHREHKKNTAVVVDLLPFIHEDELKKEISSRLRRNFPNEMLLAGLLPPKFAPVLENVLKSRNPTEIAEYVKNRRFRITATKGWSDAEFTAGGIRQKEVDDKTLESKKCPGLYLAGEILDVDGKRGGFNLAWAWASGFVSGSHAAQSGK